MIKYYTYLYYYFCFLPIGLASRCWENLIMAMLGEVRSKVVMQKNLKKNPTHNSYQTPQNIGHGIGYL